MRRLLLSLTSLIFVALGPIASAQIPNVPDTARYISYAVTSATTNFDVPFAIYGDCTDLTIKVAGIKQTSGFTCISKSGTPFANVAQPVTDAQVQFTSAVSNATVEIIGARHPRWSMGTSPGITRTELNRTLGTVLSAQREIYDRIALSGATLHTGAGAASSTIGNPGDYYFDLLTGFYYGPKVATWPLIPASSYQSNTLPTTAAAPISVVNFMTPGEITDGFSFTGSIDVTARFQAALDTGRCVYAPTGKWRITSHLTASKDGGCLIGEGFAENNNQTTGPFEPNAGTIIYFDYNAGNSADGDGLTISGQFFRVENLEFRNRQTAPSANWAPQQGPWCIHAVSNQFAALGGHRPTIRHVMLRNCWNGIWLDTVRGGLLDDITGQTFNVGILIDGDGDVTRVNNIHLGWPVWTSLSTTVCPGANCGGIGGTGPFDYQIQHSTGIVLGRVDNPNFTNIFLFHQLVGLQTFVRTNPYLTGTVSRLQGANIGFDDIGGSAMQLQDSVDVDLANVYCANNPLFANSSCLGNVVVGGFYPARINITNGDFTGSNGNSLIFNVGTGGNASTINLNNVRIRSFNQGGGGASAINASANVTVNATNLTVEQAGTVFSGAGTFSQAVSSVSPAFTGTPTTPTAAVDTNTTQIASTAFVLGQAASATPLINGAAAAGTSTRYARADHVHPTDTSRAALASPTFTGTPAAPTAAVDTNTTQLATTAFVLAQSATATPLINGAAAAGTSTRYARADHVHPTDTTRAPTSRLVSTSGSLSGGGDLTADRTLAYGGDGSWTAFTPTVTYNNTPPTTATASGRWKQIGSKTISAVMSLVVTTVGPATGTFNLTLPSSLNATNAQPCLMVDANAGLNVNFASTNASGNTVYAQPWSWANHTYTVVCNTIEVN